MKTPQGSEEFIHHHKQIRDEDTECANTQYNLGVSLMEEGKLDEAIGAFNDAVANSFRMFEGYVNLGYIYFKKGELDMVVEVNQKAVQMEPRYARG
ncbi:MAG: tetratricopeptide repeat protein, partial [Desulfobacteraceae bacterium 4572_87]